MAGSAPSDRPIPLLLALADAAESAGTATALRNRNFRVMEAHDGAAAMVHVRRDRPTAAVVDLYLDGEVDGFELAHWLRRDHPEVGLVLASRRPPGAAPDSSLGAVPVIPLPLDLDRLVALLRSGPSGTDPTYSGSERNAGAEHALHRVGPSPVRHSGCGC